MPLTFTKATRKGALLRMALAGPSGSGKTLTALELATGIVTALGGGGIAVIDTERRSASKYADLHDDRTGELLYAFDTLELEDFHPERYIEAIHAAEHAAYPVLIIDSLSHAWFGKGGALDLVDDASDGGAGNSYFAWRSVTPIQNELIEAILQCSCHVICTMRTTTAYVINTDRGKSVPEKIGLKPIQRPNHEYEYDVVGMLDTAHRLRITKSRLMRLADKEFLRPDRSLGALIMRELTHPSGGDTNAGARAADALYGDGAGAALRDHPRGGTQPPAGGSTPPGASQGPQTPHDAQVEGLIVAISALVQQSGRDVGKYWEAAGKRFRVKTSRDMTGEQLTGIQQECATYLGQQRQRQATKEALPRAQASTPPPVVTPPPERDDIADPQVPDGATQAATLPEWLLAWRAETSALLPKLQDIFLAGGVRDALTDDALTLFYAEELTEKLRDTLAAQAGEAESEPPQQEITP